MEEETLLKPRAAIYCRTANADDFTVEPQRQSLFRLAKEKGFDDLVEYLDKGQKCTTLDRPAFKRLTEDMVAGEIQIVFVKNASRLSRDCIALAEWLEMAHTLGVEVISENGDIADGAFRQVQSAIREMMQHR